MVSYLLRATASLVGAVVWWFVDKMWGDRVFSALKPHLPEWHLWAMSFEELLRLAVSYAPLLALVALAAFFFREGRRRTPGQATVDQSQRASVSIKDGDSIVAIGAQHAAGSINNLTSPAGAPVARQHPYNWTVRQAYQYRVSLLGRRPTGDEMFDIFKEFRQEALDGTLIVRGIPRTLRPILGLEQPHKTIPPTHWRSMNFYVIAYTLDATNDEAYEAATEPDGLGKLVQLYYGLMVSEAQVKALWPPRNASSRV